MEQFKVVKTIGKGGYGKAMLVESVKDKRLRIIKQVSMNDMSDAQKEGARREVEILSSLRHSNIIRYRGSKVQGSTLFILMDYAEGGDLATIIKERNGQRLHEEQIIDCFVQLCLAVKYIHDRKIIHRDIKPANIFLDSKGLIKLGDFGLARFLPSTQAFVQTAIGSPYYLPPEICRGQSYNSKADIWSLGCVLFELCCLRRPFNGNSLQSIMHNIKTLPVPHIVSGYSPELSNLVAMLLNKTPAARPDINKILTLPFLRYKAVALLGPELAAKELGHGVFHGVEPGMTPKSNSRDIKILNDLPYDEEDKIEFMGRTLVLDVNKDATPKEKAQKLREFLISIMGESKLNTYLLRLYNATDEDIAGIVKNNMDKWSVDVVLQLIALEEMADDS